MKTAICYAITHNTWRAEFRILAVTTERHGMVYGREVPDGPAVHVAGRDVLARHPTLEAAQAAIAKAEAKRAELRPAVKAARDHADRLADQMKTAVARAARGETQTEGPDHD